MTVLFSGENDAMNSSPEYDSEPELFCHYFTLSGTIFGVIYILIFILSIMGNLFVFYVLIVDKTLKKVTKVFILNLSCSDLVFTFTLPFWAVSWLHHWVFGDFFCKFITAMYYIGLYSSVILLTAMTVDRFLTVVLPNGLNKPVRRQRCAMASCAIAWIISFAACVYDTVRVEAATFNDITYCYDPSNHSDIQLSNVLQVSLLFFLPLVIIVMCYSAILRKVLQTSCKKTIRTVLVILCIIAAFFICWCPYNLILVINSFYKPIGCYEKQRLDVAISITQLIAYSHCCMNPMLYLLSHKWRRNLFQVLHCERVTRRNLEKGTGPNTSVYPNAAFTVQSSAVALDVPNVYSL